MADPITILNRHQVAIAALSDELSGMITDNRANYFETVGILADYLVGKFSFSAPVGPNGPPDLVAKAQTTQAFPTTWVDGETVVSANAEDGFNSRFAALLADIGAVAADARNAFAAVTALRAEVSKALAEVGAELNALHKRIDGLAVATGPTVVYEPPDLTPYPRDPYGIAVPQYYPQGLPSNQPQVLGPMINELMRDGALPNWATSAANPVNEPIWRAGSDPDVGYLRGMQVRRVDIAKFGGKDMEVWDSPMGLLMRPVAAGVTVEAPVLVPGLVGDVGSFQQMVEENAADVGAALAGGAITVKDFTDKFGGRTLSSGRTVGQLFANVPKDKTLDSVEAIVGTAAGEVGRYLDSSGGTEAAIAGTVGLSNGVMTGEIDTGAVKFVPLEARTALVEAGVGNMGTLATTSPGRVVEIMREKGIETSLEEAASWTGTSLVMVEIGNRGRVR